MKGIVRQWMCLVAASVLLSVPLAAVAAESPVLQVLTVKVKGDSNAYLAKLKEGKVKSILMRLGASQVRVFRATLAGPDSGLIFVSTEYPSMEAFGKAAVKVATDAELQKLARDLDASGMREIVSSSLLSDVTPAEEGKP